MSPWTTDTGPIAAPALFADLARAQTVLLGERHDRADIHRWQLHTAAGLAAHRPIVMGFEMFPARLDPVLADWVAGRIGSEDAFLTRAEWGSVWGFPPELYLPLFRFCREAGVPMLGLNVRRGLVRAVGAGGWEAVPEDEREGLTPAKPSPVAYRRFIFDLAGGGPGRRAQGPGDPAFDRFVRAQEVWDRAFATHIARAARGPGNPLVVGIIGMGHLQFGGGVPWQLADLGIADTRVLIPHDPGARPAPGAADAAFALPPALEAPLPRPAPLA